jgi:hypothetical protein
MRDIIKNRTVVADDWTVLRLHEGDAPAISPDSIEVPVGKVIVPLTVWQAQREKLQGRAYLGVFAEFPGGRRRLPEIRGRPRLFDRL